MSIAERKTAWAKLVKEKALQTIFDVHRFNARNRGSFVSQKTDGLHTEVTKIQRQVTNSSQNSRTGTLPKDYVHENIKASMVQTPVESGRASKRG